MTNKEEVKEKIKLVEAEIKDRTFWLEIFDEVLIGLKEDLKKYN